MSSIISRRKLATVEDFLKALSDQIREERMGSAGSTNRGATLSLLSINPDKLFVLDTLSSDFNTQSLSETATPSDVSLSYTAAAGSFHIAYGNDGNIAGLTWGTGKYRGSLSYSGGYVEVVDSSSLDFIGNFTMDFWVNPNSGASQMWLVGKGGGWTRAGFFSALWPTLVIRFSISGGTNEVVTDNAGITTGEWQHIACVYNNPNMTVYRNGSALLNTTSSAATYVNNYPVRIGGSDGASPLYLDGSVDEVKIYNRALSAGEVLSNYNGNITKDGMVLYLSFDEGSGSSSTDLTGALIGYSEIG